MERIPNNMNYMRTKLYFLAALFLATMGVCGCSREDEETLTVDQCYVGQFVNADASIADLYFRRYGVEAPHGLWIKIVTMPENPFSKNYPKQSDFMFAYDASKLTGLKWEEGELISFRITGTLVDVAPIQFEDLIALHKYILEPCK